MKTEYIQKSFMVDIRARCGNIIIVMCNYVIEYLPLKYNIYV